MRLSISILVRVLKFTPLPPRPVQTTRSTIADGVVDGAVAAVEATVSFRRTKIQFEIGKLKNGIGNLN